MRDTGSERRRVTVLFCDLVGSTGLSDALDPEDYTDVMHGYYAACGRVIEGMGGWIADYLGDGIVVYFGYPNAHEDDPVRAVRSGLSLVKAVADLRAQLADEAVALGCRIGIETGLVVVGESSDPHSREPVWALGRTVNLAARLQSIAEPGSVVIGEGTRALVEGWFHLESLGEHTVKGIARPTEVYRVIVETAAKDRLHAALPRGLAPLADREEQVAALAGAWDGAERGDGGAVMLRGEAGIGKSRLALTLLERLRGTGVALVDLYCMPDDVASPLRPVLEYLERKLDFEPEDTPAERLAKLEARLARSPSGDPDALELIAEMLVPEAGGPPVDAPPQERRARAMRILADLLVPERGAALILVEDLHWADPSTAELVGLVIDRLRSASALAVLTARPEFHAPWLERPHVHTIDVPPLAAESTAALAASVAGGALPREAQALIHARTEGVPLFVEELTRMALDSGLVSIEGGRAVMRGPFEEAVPGTVYDLLVARLGRLGPEAAVAQFAAVLGNEFSVDFLRAVVPEEEELDSKLELLVHAGVVQRRVETGEETFRFSHALVRDAAYGLLLHKRRRELHGRVADVLVKEFPDTVAARPELAAPHFTQSGRVEQAIAQWTKAGERAASQYALHEAIDHYQRALELIRSLPGSPERARREIEATFALAPLIQNATGFGDPRVAELHSRIVSLSHWLESDAERFTFLAYSWAVNMVLANYDVAHDLGGRLVEIAERSPSTARKMLAYGFLGTTLFQRGDIGAAMPLIDRVVELYDPVRHENLIRTTAIDPGGVAIGYRAWGEWHLGLLDRAARTAAELLSMAEAHPHPFRSATAHVWVAGLAYRLRDPEAAGRNARAAIAIADEHGYEELERYATCIHGWASAVQGRPIEGTAEIRRGLALVPHGGSRAHSSWLIAMLAEAEHLAASPVEALASIRSAQAFSRETGEMVLAPELRRLEGEILLASGNIPEAEAAFVAATEAAVRMRCAPLELRTASSLYRLRPDDASRAALATCYAGFTEGFDVPDLREARALLDASPTA